MPTSSIRQDRPERTAGRIPSGCGWPWIAPLFVAACCGAATAFAQQPDRLMLLPSGSETGKVTAVTPDGVAIEGREGESKTVPIENIREVQFGGEPQTLKAARSLLARGRPSDALEQMKKLREEDFQDAQPLVIEERAFVEAAAAARAAIQSDGDVSAAERGVSGFLDKHKNSHHTYELREMLGDLLAKAGRPDEAIAAYENLLKGPPAFQVRAASAKARMLFDQKKFDEAAAAFDQALAVDASDAASKAQKRAAELGKARCMSQSGKGAEAVEVVLRAIRQASPEEKQLLAGAYNTLGFAQRAAGKDQDALIAYLTVDLVYNAVPEAHAEALANLVELWQKANNPERSRQALQSLESTYPGSSWTKQAKASAEKT